MRVLCLLLKNARKTVAVSSAPPPRNRGNSFAIWRPASVPFALLATAVLTYAARPDATAADIVEAVTTGVATKADDALIAAELKKLRVTERLTDQIVGFLSAEGVGPETLKTLEQLAKKSAALPMPAVTPASRDPAPDANEFQRMLAGVGRYVAHYMRGLPDFTCDQITHRFTNVFGLNTPQPYYDPTHFRKIDTLVYTLRFTGSHDHSTLMAVNGKGMKHLFLSAGESISTGEFGGDMRMVMGPGNGSIIQWSHWQALSGVRAAVFSYTVGPAHTRFQVTFCCIRKGDKEYQQSVISPIEGLLFVNPENGEILRMIIRPVRLPGDFEVTDTRTLIDYRLVRIADHSYRLPVRALSYMETRTGQRTRNDIVFTNYRKFDAESVLLFTDSKVTYQGEKKP